MLLNEDDGADELEEWKSAVMRRLEWCNVMMKEVIIGERKRERTGLIY